MEFHSNNELSNNTYYPTPSPSPISSYLPSPASPPFTPLLVSTGVFGTFSYLALLNYQVLPADLGPAPPTAPVHSAALSLSSLTVRWRALLTPAATGYYALWPADLGGIQCLTVRTLLSRDSYTKMHITFNKK